MENKFMTLLKMEALEIANSFQIASVEGEGTSQEVADRREEIVADFLAKYFPFPYRIVKGNIVDSYGNRSNSIDCIVLNPSHPYTINTRNSKASIIFADGVDFAVEVKPDMANKKEIERGLEQIRSVKKLRRKRDGLLMHDKYTAEQIEEAKRIPTIIFADKTYAEIRTLVSNIVDYYVVNNIPKKEQFDLIVVNNRTILHNVKKEMPILCWDKEGIVYCETKENTMAEFLFWLNRVPKSEPEIGQNIINIYLRNMQRDSFKYFQDLNDKLMKIEQ